MELATWVEALHDNSNKIILFKAYVPLLGLKASILLMHLTTTMDNGYRVYADEDGVLWHKQSLKWMLRQSTLSEHGLRVAKKKLVELGLVHIKSLQSFDRTTYWRVDAEKLSRFCAFAHALYAATRPNNEHTLPQWQTFAKIHPDIVEEFKPLYPRLGQFGVLEMKPVSIGSRLKKQNPAPQKQVNPCKFVEYWNTQADVPRCKMGTKAYETARKFFAAHRKYEAGNCSGFMLDSDEQARIRLDKVNRVPPTAERRGPKKTPVRSDEQMFRHIERAARAYRKDYEPKRKELLPRDLSTFLFNSHSKRYGAASMFLERIGIFPPRLIDDTSRAAILRRATPEELDTVEVLKRLFDQANDHLDSQELSLRDLKTALDVARAILEKYAEIPVDEVSIFAAHFGSYNWFLDWYEKFAADQVWSGMPIGALHPKKDIWRRFVDFVSSDIGYDLFTGERI